MTAFKSLICSPQGVIPLSPFLWVMERMLRSLCHKVFLTVHAAAATTLLDLRDGSIFLGPGIEIPTVSPILTGGKSWY